MKIREQSEKEVPKNKEHMKMLERGKKTAKAILEAEAREKKRKKSKTNKTVC